MRSVNQRKHRNHPFLTLLEKKEKGEKAHRKSTENKAAIETHQYLEHDAIDGQSLTKNRGKTAKYPRQYSINRNNAINHSFMDLGREAKTKRSLLEENTELRKKLEHIALNKHLKKDPIAKKISTEFEKEMYWTGSHTYMISGIKLQYQKIK